MLYISLDLIYFAIFGDMVIFGLPVLFIWFSGSGLPTLLLQHHCIALTNLNYDYVKGTSNNLTPFNKNDVNLYEREKVGFVKVSF